MSGKAMASAGSESPRPLASIWSLPAKVFRTSVSLSPESRVAFWMVKSVSSAPAPFLSSSEMLVTRPPTASLAKMLTWSTAFVPSMVMTSVALSSRTVRLRASILVFTPVRMCSTSATWSRSMNSTRPCVSAMRHFWLAVTSVTVAPVGVKVHSSASSICPSSSSSSPFRFMALSALTKKAGSAALVLPCGRSWMFVTSRFCTTMSLSWSSTRLVPDPRMICLPASMVTRATFDPPARYGTVTVSAPVPMSITRSETLVTVILALGVPPVRRVTLTAFDSGVMASTSAPEVAVMSRKSSPSPACTFVRKASPTAHSGTSTLPAGVVCVSYTVPAISQRMMSSPSPASMSSTPPRPSMSSPPPLPRRMSLPRPPRSVSAPSPPSSRAAPEPLWIR